MPSINEINAISEHRFCDMMPSRYAQKFTISNIICADMPVIKINNIIFADMPVIKINNAPKVYNNTTFIKYIPIYKTSPNFYIHKRNKILYSNNKNRNQFKRKRYIW
ncbi:Hypothetical protein ORPV_887 [Orpheovirus IHUMI-LCC2]|uniref:Uncharacterized protein n=1 Tax=Orpheovirus IHUMI-LCC2 TaxID=2023057 RepID=A0A2I2L5K0_9VIRU|nr:Hypothetical protein ORPV_887 [Orpheovirus IHUMI-LCC2]SNW62791.1 Hypothetical protein ORPV_887 [Orpheovirus IHUMI-LCC2]